MSERDKLWAMLMRVNAVCDRNTKIICQSVQARTGLQKLDELFAVGERGHALFMKIHTRWQATLEPEDRI